MIIYDIEAFLNRKKKIYFVLFPVFPRKNYFSCLVAHLKDDFSNEFSTPVKCALMELIA
jgi:predicted transcriptional regulator with HTH domain